MQPNENKISGRVRESAPRNERGSITNETGAAKALISGTDALYLLA